MNCACTHTFYIHTVQKQTHVMTAVKTLYTMHNNNVTNTVFNQKTVLNYMVFTINPMSNFYYTAQVSDVVCINTYIKGYFYN